MSIKFILLNPQLPQNIGMAIRSSLNFGITNLVVVNPLNKNFINLLNNTDAGALNQITLTVENSLQNAVKNSQIVLALTARMRNISKPVLTLSNMFNNLHNNYNINVHNTNIAVIFGAEQSGLANEDLLYANYIINIKNNNKFSSINLSHALILVAYEYFNFINANNSTKQKSSIASLTDLQFMLQDLSNKLEHKGYFSQPTRKPITINNLFNIYQKANLSTQEVKTLVGVHKILFGYNHNK